MIFIDFNQGVTFPDDPLRPSSGHTPKQCAFIDNFEFITNKAFDIWIGKLMLFWLGSFLEISQVAFLLDGCRHEMAAVAVAALPWLTHPELLPAVNSLLAVHTAQLVFGAAALWVIFKFVFVFPDSGVCCQSALRQVQSVSVSIISYSRRRCKLSQLKKSRMLRVSMLNSYKNLALRQSRYFNIVTDQRSYGAMNLPSDSIRPAAVTPALFL